MMRIVELKSFQGLKIITFADFLSKFNKFQQKE